MPPDLARTYRTFVARMCVSLAMASGGGLFTNPISDVEAAVIRKIATALRLEITDKVERLLLGMDASDDNQEDLRPPGAASRGDAREGSFPASLLPS